LTAKKIGLVKDFDYVPLKGVTVNRKEILVVKLGKNFFAIGNTCTHMGCRLSSGRLEGKTIQCPCHGSVFNVMTGEVVKGLAKRSEPSYTVLVEHDELSIDV
jgi:3-phenylpropionate/trans-cinnamate dioxygenase ferredoxin component